MALVTQRLTRPLVTRGVQAAVQPSGESILETLPQEQEDSLIQSLRRKSGQAIENLFLALDTPGAIARGFMAGDPLSGFSWDTERRVSGPELLQHFGINPTNPYKRAIAGFSTELITDPTFWFSGGLSALSKGGDAARAAGLLKTAPLAYMSKYGVEAAEQTARGKYLANLFDAAEVPRTIGNYKAVPPVGQRVAQMRTTLQDVVEQAPDQASALQRVVNRLGSAEEYGRVKDQPLGGLLGLNVGRINHAIAPPGSEKILGALDKLDAAIRFSAPVRGALSMVSKPLQGAIGVGDQVAALRASGLEELGARQARADAAKHTMLLTKIGLSPNSRSLLGADTLFSPQGNDLLTRLAENKANVNDLKILAETPGLSEWAANWDAIRNRQFTDRAAMGLKGPARYEDEFGVQYTPRYGDEFDFEGQARGVGKALYTAAEPETYGRKWYMKTPGGTDDLRKISLLPDVIAHSQPGAKSTDEKVGAAIVKWFEQNHPAEPIGLEQGIRIAQAMKRRRSDLPNGVPVFAAHPANAQARRMMGHEVALSRANFILEGLAESAVRGDRAQMTGQYRNLAQSFDEIGRKTGFSMAGDGTASKSAMNALRAKMASALGVDPKTIDLSKFAVPERTVRRMERIADFYSVPKAQEVLMGYLDGWTKLFKGFVLATPRRFVRDAYSNAISLFLETGDAPDTLYSMYAASNINAGKWDSAMSALRNIPAYKGLTDDQIKQAFTVDSATHGVLSGLQSSELLSTSRSGEMAQLVPGSTPVKISSAINEFIPDGTRTPGQMVGDFFSPFTDFLANKVERYEQRNPVLRASGKINDAIDSMGRLGGFIALMRKGYSAEEAAIRVKKSLVDYQDMSLMERQFFRKIFPWYAYNSKIGAYVAESLYMRPGGAYGQLIRASNTLQQGDDNEYIPANLRKQFAIRLPDEFMKATGMYQPGVRTYVKDFDLPGVDVINLLDPSGLQGTMRNLAAQSSPPIQSLISYITNRDLFTDRPLDEATTPADRIYRSLTGSPEGLHPLTKTLVNLAPGLQTPLSIGGALADDRINDFSRRLAKAVLNYTSGIKVQDIDERYLLEELQQKIAEELKGKTRTLSKAYIPDELMPTLTPRQQALYTLSKQKAKESLEIRKQRELEKKRRAGT